MNARQRKAARKRATRKHFPIGAKVEWNRHVGDWFVYGYKGQHVKIRRKESQSGYQCWRWELRRMQSDEISLPGFCIKVETWRPEISQ